jgi:hypothetical protein
MSIVPSEMALIFRMAMDTNTVNAAYIILPLDFNDKINIR